MTRTGHERGRPRLAAVVLTGGRGARLGGVDKAALVVAGGTLLEHALAAAAAAAEVVVVGPARETSRPVTWAREDPPGGGPGAAVLAGLDGLAAAGTQPELVLLLAVDMPGFTGATVERLVTELGAAGPEVDGVCLLDREQAPQWLAGVYRHRPLSARATAFRGASEGLSMRRLLADLRIRGVAGVAAEARDVDTWEDLRHFR